MVYDGPVSEAVVFDCPSCHAPLPAARDGTHATCTFCNTVTTIDYSGASMVREKASRAEAEALFESLGQPPSPSQRAAVFLTRWWLWVFGLPFMVTATIRIAHLFSHLVSVTYERMAHARITHVAPAPIAWLLQLGVPLSGLVSLLVWSLFGERLDARSALQLALASKPPKTAGGPAVCRHCDAGLVVPPDALGVRCAFCGADNLVQIPAALGARAHRIDVALRLDAKAARARARAGRRQVLVAAAWRVPIILAALAFIAIPAWRLAGTRGWEEARAARLARVAIWHGGAGVGEVDRAIHACGDAEQMTLSTTDSGWRDELGNWKSYAVVALEHGEHLRLSFEGPGAIDVRVALGDEDYTGSMAMLYDGFGDQRLEQLVQSGDAPTDLTIDVSGWYTVRLLSASEATLAPCIVAAARR